MDEFEEMDLLHVDAKGRDSHDRHYFGLVRSLVIGVRRMMSWCDRQDAQSGTKDTKKLATGLLMSMSMLDRTKTPTSLFTQLYRDDSGDDLEHGASVSVYVCVNVCLVTRKFVCEKESLCMWCM